MSNAAHAASRVRKTPIGGLRGDVARLISLADGRENWCNFGAWCWCGFGAKLKIKFGACKKARSYCAPCFLITVRVDVSTLASNAGIKFSRCVFKMYTNFGNLLKFK